MKEGRHKSQRPFPDSNPAGIVGSVLDVPRWKHSLRNAVQMEASALLIGCHDGETHFDGAGVVYSCCADPPSDGADGADSSGKRHDHYSW